MPYKSKLCKKVYRKNTILGNFFLHGVPFLDLTMLRGNSNNYKITRYTLA